MTNARQAGHGAKLAIVVEDESEWLAAFDFAAAGISALLLHCREDLEPFAELSRRKIPYQVQTGSPKLALPDFAEIVAALEQEQVEACFILSDSPFARLAALAADLIGISVFVLVTGTDQLANLAQRRKPSPDLFFLADSRLFPAALSDPRYGSTLLPTGHPGRDLFLRDRADRDPSFDDRSFGNGEAASRILSAIERWRCDALEHAEPDLSIIIPAYNEADNLPLVCQRLLDTFEGESIAMEILLIDDVSRDATYDVALEQMWRSPRIRAFRKPLPRGMGNGIRYGLLRARAAVVAVTMGDGSDEVVRIPEMFRQVSEQGMSLAIGSRYRHRRNYRHIPRLYRFWSFCFRLTARLTIGLKLKDYTNAFRVYRKDIFERYGPESGGFEISPETTFKAWFASRNVVEVDVCHLKRASGQSHFSFLAGGPGYGRILFKAFVNRLTGKWFTLDW